jgi:hypothetical protein
LASFVISPEERPSIAVANSLMKVTNGLSGVIFSSPNNFPKMLPSRFPSPPSPPVKPVPSVKVRGIALAVSTMTSKAL